MKSASSIGGSSSHLHLIFQQIPMLDAILEEAQDRMKTMGLHFACWYSDL